MSPKVLALTVAFLTLLASVPAMANDPCVVYRRAVDKAAVGSDDPDPASRAQWVRDEKPTYDAAVQWYQACEAALQPQLVGHGARTLPPGF